jgi:hypothetical protein
VVDSVEIELAPTEGIPIERIRLDGPIDLTIQFAILGVVLLGFLSPILKKILEVKRTIKKDIEAKNWDNITGVYKLLRKYKDELGIRSIHLYKTSNGGGIPSLDSCVNITQLHAIDESPAKQFCCSGPHALDETSASLLAELNRNNTKVLFTNSVCSTSFFGGIAKKAKITYTIFIKVHKNRTRFMFIAANFSVPWHSKTDAQRISSQQQQLIALSRSLEALI